MLRTYYNILVLRCTSTLTTLGTMQSNSLTMPPDNMSHRTGAHAHKKLDIYIRYVHVTEIKTNSSHFYMVQYVSLQGIEKLAVFAVQYLAVNSML